MKRRSFRLGWVVAVLALASLACTCGLVQGFTQAQEGLQTAQSLATQVVTVQALATQVATSGAIETLESAATQAATSGALETVEAVGTEVEFGEAPADIPVMEGADNLFAAKELVNYTTGADFNAVVDFYKQEMIANGWADSDSPIEAPGTAILTYQKENREAIVTISGDGNQTTVAIIISSQ